LVRDTFRKLLSSASRLVVPYGDYGHDVPSGPDCLWVVLKVKWVPLLTCQLAGLLERWTGRSNDKKSMKKPASAKWWPASSILGDTASGAKKPKPRPAVSTRLVAAAVNDFSTCGLAQRWMSMSCLREKQSCRLRTLLQTFTGQFGEFVYSNRLYRTNKKQEKPTSHFSNILARRLERWVGRSQIRRRRLAYKPLRLDSELRWRIW
jgi:hypothetical protein